MIRVHVICEGQTEEMFVNELMRNYFWGLQIDLVPALIGKPGHKGGRVEFQRLFTDIRNRLLGDTTAYCTTFFDFYGTAEDFPGKQDAYRLSVINDKADAVNAAVVEALKVKLGDSAVSRFIPFVQMYEFEGLLFSDTQAFSKGIGKQSLHGQLQNIRAAFQTPEHVNDSPDTAPSKRVGQLINDYEKPIMGSLAAMEIGLAKIRQECRLFDGWLTQLEALSAQGGQ